MKQIAGLFLLLVALMLAVAWFSKEGNSSKIFNVLESNPLSTSPTPEPKQTITVGSNVFSIDVADTQDERQIGLSDHESLNNDTGMLFKFEKQNTRPSFWMKGMKFSIDIVWIDNDKVIQLNTDVASDPENTPDTKLRLYTPNQPVDYVLELAAGSVKEKKVRVGDKVVLP
jgi:uncharacterized membrane protein (UPF0127 family)